MQFAGVERVNDILLLTITIRVDTLEDSYVRDVTVPLHVLWTRELTLDVLTAILEPTGKEFERFLEGK